MSRKKAFTLIELMVVVLVVAILAAVTIPIMRGRIDAAKWSEGKVMANTIAETLRDYAAEKEEDSNISLTKGGFDNWNKELGFKDGDLTGEYFVDEDFQISDYNYGPPLTFTIVVATSQPNAPAAPETYQLDQDGNWIEK